MDCQRSCGTALSLLRNILLCLPLCLATAALAPAEARAADMLAEDTMDSQALPDFTTLWNFSDPAGTRAQFEELLPAAEAGADSLYLIELLTQIARTHGLEGNFDNAHLTLNRAQELLQAGDEAALRRGWMRYWLERGRAFNSAGSPQVARPLFLEAWLAGQDGGNDSLTIDAAHMLGIVTQGDESLEWNEKALALAASSSDPKAAQWAGSLYNNIGWTYMDNHQPQLALEKFEAGAQFRDANNHPEEPRMIAHWSVARALRELGRNPEALAKLQNVADNFPGHSADCFWHEEMGENTLAMEGLEAARPHFENALPLLKEQAWVAESYPGRIERIETMLATGLPLLEIGSRALQFTLPNQDGKEVSLAEALEGGPVVLAFYPKDHTGGCTLELAEYNRREAEFAAFNARVFGISGDSTESHEEFCAAQGYRLDLLADTDNAVRGAYGAATADGRIGRVSYVVSSDGYIRGFCASSSEMEAHAAAALEILGRMSGE
ncbi:MAG: peroxiredoxin [bacterium]